ncbi:MAG: hypothetical protein COB02_02255 [Candidatus Cloacimonadota bacterium]|nr:MAG: hypothetical protein COB02_02255 [Candidatus Cloacimonadota bacterium]
MYKILKVFISIISFSLLFCSSPSAKNLLFPDGFKKYKKRPMVKRPYENPFLKNFHNQKNHLVDQDETDFITLQRLSSMELIAFLNWWEKKYFLIDTDLETLYGGNLSVEQINPGKYWRNLSHRFKNKLRINWFKKNNEKLLKEFKHYLIINKRSPYFTNSHQIRY